MRVLVAVCLLALVAGASAEGPTVSDLTTNVLSNVPSSANVGDGSNPNRDVQGCLESCPPLDEHSELAEAIKTEEKQEEMDLDYMGEQVTFLQGKVDEAQKCKDEKIRLEEELKELNERWKKLGNKVLTARLERRLDLDRDALSKVNHMARKLKNNVAALNEAAGDMETKLRLQEETITNARNSANGVSFAMPAFTKAAETEYEHVVTKSLEDQLTELHKQQMDTVATSQKQQLELLKGVPELADTNIEAAFDTELKKVDAEGNLVDLSDEEKKKIADEEKKAAAADKAAAPADDKKADAKSSGLVETSSHMTKRSGMQDKAAEKELKALKKAVESLRKH